MQKITSLRMLPWVVKHRWMFVAILLCGMFVNNSRSECPGTDNKCTQKNVLFVSVTPIQNDRFPSKAVYNNVNGTKLCFNIQKKNQHADCCNTAEFNCSFNVSGYGNKFHLILNEELLSKQDIVVMTSPEQNYNCTPSKLYNTSSDLLYKVHKCLHKGNENFRLSQNDLCGNTSGYNDGACEGFAETDSYFEFLNKERQCLSCKAPGKKPPISLTLNSPDGNNGTAISPENAANVMNNLSFLLDYMGNSSAASITMGEIKGVITKLPTENQTSFNFGIKKTGDMNILEDKTDSVTGFSRAVQIPSEAIAMAVKSNGSFAAVLLFPGMRQDDPKSSFFNNEVVGIEMGTEISNLSHTIDIRYKSVEKNGSIASCRSWNGKGKEANWITDGCKTKEINDSITCQCSHLTFFAILLSPPPGNISTSDLKSLTYITSIGCGLSMFFLAVALFMYCLIRKGKASQSTKLLMNLFVAMFNLNLFFLVNESIAKLGNFNACVAMAAVMHYSMLATFSWFFIQALHLYFNMWKLPTEVKHYVMKVCVAGWVTPAVVVIALLATRQYDYIVINSNDGNSAKMCWIPDAVIHQGVNIGYYTVVFIFTFGIFVMTVRQIILLKPKAVKAQDNDSIKTNSFSILGLFLLLGITWAFAFFSYGPLRIPSYYIFTILNSFQGFFLFIYYYNSSKVVAGDKPTTVSTNSTATTNTVVSPLH